MSNVKDNSRNMIETIAQLVRDKLQLSIPVDMMLAVSNLGGECVPVATTEYDAKIETINNSDFQFRINYAQDQIEERIRFSIAHELGHLFLHMLQQDGCLSPDTYFRGKQSNSSFVEWEANEFAASLLMPKDEFVTFCMNKQNEDDSIDLDCVAKHFRVSKQAAYVRGSILNLW